MEDQQVLAIALHDYTGDPKQKILSFKSGDQFLVIKDETKNWWAATRIDGLDCETGFVPKNYITVQEEYLRHISVNSEETTATGNDETISGNNSSFDIDLDDSSKTAMLCLYDFDAKTNDQMSFKKDDVIYVDYNDEDEWLAAWSIDKRYGLVPANHLEKYDDMSSTSNSDSREDDDMEEDDDDYDEELDVSEDQNSFAVMAIAKYSHVKDNYVELGFKTGDLLWVEPDTEKWWRARDERGAQGLVPSNYITIISGSFGRSAEFELGKLIHWEIFRWLFKDIDLQSNMKNNRFEKAINNTDIFTIKKLSHNEHVDMSKLTIVLDGSVLLMRRSSDNRELGVCSYTGTHWFGESFVLGEPCRLDIWFLAQGESTTVIQLSREGLDALVNEFGSRVRQNLAGLSDKRSPLWIRKSLATLLPPLQDEEHLRLMGFCLKFRFFEANVEVRNAGEHHRDLFLILTGKAFVLSAKYTFSAGDVLNAKGFLHMGSQGSHFSALTDLETCVLRYSDFVGIRDSLDPVTIMELNSVVDLPGQIFRTLPLFKNLSRNALDALFDKTVLVSEETDIEDRDLETIYSSFFVVVLGSIEIVNGTTTKLISTRECYGTECFLGKPIAFDRFRITQYPFLCLSLKDQSIEAILSTNPSLKQQFEQNILVGVSDARNDSESVEHLAGYDSTNSRTDDAYWQNNENLAIRAVWKELGDTMSGCHKIFDTWPFYVYRENEKSMMVGENVSFNVRVSGLHHLMMSTTKRFKSTDTVEMILMSVFKTASKIVTIDVEGIQPFTLKVHGRSDYLVFRDIPLRYYKFLAPALKTRTEIDLVLVDLRYPCSSVGSGVFAHSDGYRPSANKPPKLAGMPLVGKPSYTIFELHKEMKRMAEKSLNVRYAWEEVSRDRQVAVNETRVDDWKYRVKIVGLDKFEKHRREYGEDITEFRMRVDLVYANSVIESVRTDRFKMADASRVQLNRWVSFDICKNTLPLSTRLCFTILGYAKPAGEGSNQAESEAVIMGGAAIQIFDYLHTLQTGKQVLTVWPGKPGEMRIFPVNNVSNDSSQLVICLDQFLYPLYYRIPDTRGMKLIVSPFTDDAQALMRERLDAKLLTVNARLPQLMKLDPTQVYQMKASDRALIFQNRKLLLQFPHTIARVMYSVDWFDFSQRQAAMEYLRECVRPNVLEAMELLDCNFGDFTVRHYAVQCLESATDEDLEDFMLQLVQVLKYEPFHDSALARFLLRRAWLNPREIGTKLFWYLRSEMHSPIFSHRYYIMLSCYLGSSCKRHLADFTTQIEVLDTLKRVADAVVKRPKNSQVPRVEIMSSMLNRLRFPAAFQLPLDPKIVVNKILVEGCKVMNSKKKPLWLKLQRVDCLGDDHCPGSAGLGEKCKQCKIAGAPTLVIFKSGDDLRQDQMTLQLLRIMEQMWMHAGLDMKMSPYMCITTGNEVGMIEVVTQSDTLANIQKEYGRIGALRSATLSSWLTGSNTKDGKDKKNALTPEMIENFKYSCAGYCVATYVMGIGDRHSDNIMLSKDGKLFHIDFGHFLGHFKSKAGFKRERSPFVFTKEMAHVLGGKGSKDYNDFVDLCCQCYNILRRNSDALINLFRLMEPADIPELQTNEDIQYLCNKLLLDKNDRQAAQAFKKEINVCLSDTYRRFDNLIHNTKTG